MKYKVTTGNLDWVNVDKGDTLISEKGNMRNTRTGWVSFKDSEFKDIVKRHPDWFEEIVPEYTEDDMISFGEYCNGDAEIAELFNDWLKTR